MIDFVSLLSSLRQRRYAYLLIFLLINLGGFCYYLYYLTENGYLPSPFVYDKSDTLMDLFNSTYWAYDEGRYTDWGSVYPPLGFLILKVFRFIFNGTLDGDPSYMRANSIFFAWGFLLVYLLVPVLVLSTRLWQDFRRNEKILTYCCIVLSTPMLFALERGNLIVLAPILIAVALSRIGFLRAVSIALLINIKPYFIVLMIYYVVRKNWNGFLLCTIASGLIFTISGLVLDNHFLLFLRNIFDFSQNDEIFALREVMALPSSISAFSYVLKNPDGAMFASDLLSLERIKIISYIIEAAKWCVLALSLSLLFLRSRLIRDAEALSLLIVFISNLGIWVGGYTYIFYIALIPIFMKMRARWLYVGLLSLMAIPLDVIPLMSDFIGEQYTYFADAYIDIHWTLGLGSVIRPVANLILLALLSYEFIGRKHKGKNDNFLYHAKLCENERGITEKRLNYD